MNILNCILSYNRNHYLKNAVKSTINIFGYGDTIVVDDNSDNPSTLSLLGHYEGTGIKVFSPSKNLEFGKGKHGHMYFNMDFCISYAIENNYEYIQFIQDDCQFVWHDDLFEEKISRIYEQHDDASMVENLFFNIAAKPYLASKLDIYPQSKSYNRAQRGCLDLGIWRTDRLKNTRFSFGNGSENSNSFWWRKEGFRSYRLASPSMGHVPEPPVFQHGLQTFESANVPPNEFLMKPLSNKKINTLINSPIESFPYLEEYCKPWGWECEIPYILTSGEREKRQHNEKILRYKWLINFLLFTVRGRLKQFILFLLSHDTYIK